MKRATLLLVFLAACPGAKPATPGSSSAAGPTLGKMAELGLLMKNEINPAFSRLSFLLLHGDAVEEDEALLTNEIQKNAAVLSKSIGLLRAWTAVPAQSEEGRQVFFAYAESVDKSTQRLVSLISGGQRTTAAQHLEQIADTCNSCHHFFRLRIQDSVVDAGQQPGPQASVDGSAPTTSFPGFQ